MHKRLVVLIWLLIILNSCHQKSENKSSSSKKLDQTCESTVTIFFDKIKNGKYENAVNDLLLSNPNILLNDSSTIHLKAEFKEINEYSGAFTGYYLLRKHVILDDLGAYSYMVKYEKKCYRFVFIFYNNGTSTTIYRFHVDSSLDTELEESLKFYTF